MRRSGVFVVAFLCVLLLGATVVSISKYKKSEAKFAEATAAEADTRLRYDRAVGEIVSIQDSLNAIVLGPDARFVPATPLDESQPPGTLHDTVLSRITSLKSAIQRTKDRIEELDARLKKNGVQIDGLEKMIARLRRSVSEKEERIVALSTQVDTLETRVAGQQQEIAEKRTEIATVYYAMGTKKELTNAGVVTSKGGVLGIGKTLEPSGQFNEAAFVAIDTDQENVIRIPAQKAQVLSAQPVSSYVLEPVGKDMVELRIVDPAQFRKVKHLVILKA
jgi:uncharacterized coiled-coil protein SlyX